MKKGLSLRKHEWFANKSEIPIQLAFPDLSRVEREVILQMRRYGFSEYMARKFVAMLWPEAIWHDDTVTPDGDYVR